MSRSTSAAMRGAFGTREPARVGPADVAVAADVLRDIVHRTPVLDSTALSDLVGGRVVLKCENLQRAGSFKIRGAYLRMSRLTDAEKAGGVVAASAGNHAQGVALAARLLGIGATVFMPEGAALPKIAATQEYGAAVRLVGSTIDDALRAAQEHASAEGAVLIHPFDHPDVIAGQGTVGLEVLEQVPDVRTVLVPVGGGGLAAGITAALSDHPEVRVVGVQAAGAAAWPGSLAAGHPMPLTVMSTMADGIAVGRPGDVPFAILRAGGVPIHTVTEEHLSRALLHLAERSTVLVEPAAAAGRPARAGVGRPVPADADPARRPPRHAGEPARLAGRQRRERDGRQPCADRRRPGGGRGGDRRAGGDPRADALRGGAGASARRGLPRRAGLSVVQG